MAAPRIPNWQQTLLKGIGAPVTPQNLVFVNDWARAEGGSAENNPFNTTQPGYGATGNYNSVGVKRYGTPQQGIAATIATLNNGRYGGILDALRQGTDAKAAAHALAQSPWGTGGLVEKMLGAGSAAGAPPAPGPAHAAAPAPQRAPGGPSPIAAALQLLGFAAPAGAFSRPLAAPAAAPSSASPSAPVPPYRPGHGLAVPIRGAIGSEAPSFLSALTAAVKARGGVAIQATSGERSPQHNAAVGGATHSNHLPDPTGYGHALDGYAILRDGSRVPLGDFLKPNAATFGLRSGSTFNWNGRPDTVHVDDFRNGGH